MEKQLKESFKQLSDTMVEIQNARVVYVDDFIPEHAAESDQTSYFEEAMGNGNVKLILGPKRYYATIKLPSRTVIEGQGMELTTIQTPDTAPSSEWTISLRDKEQGEEYIVVKNLSLDGNRRRGSEPVGGSRSSCLTLHGVKYAWIDHVFAYNSSLHGFDVTSTGLDYHYGGDGTVDSGPSQYVWIESCKATDWVDDGFTTHHSEYITISNCYAYDPFTRGNQNGIEIDDGSRHILLSNNYTSGCYGGIEVKAHDNSSAANNVHIMGHISREDARSYNFRHIGHHTGEDPDSKSAFHLTATNLVSLHPNNKKGFQNNIDPRALVVSAYTNVSITNFTAIGDEEYDFRNGPVVAVQYKARNVILNGMNISRFNRASDAILVFGGNNRGDHISLSNINIHNSGDTNGVFVGGGHSNVSINSVNAISSNAIRNNAVETATNSVNISNVTATGYQTAIKSGGVSYVNPITVVSGGARIASSTGEPNHDQSIIISSTASPTATNSKTMVGASSNSHAEGEGSFILGSAGNSRARGPRSSIISSSAAIAGQPNGGFGSMVVASNLTSNPNSYSVVGGYGATGNSSSSNRKWELDSRNGTIKASGRITGSETFADFAEYFESMDGRAIQTGMLVALEGDKVRLANQDDDIIGVISQTAGVLLGEASFHWKGRYLKNDFGAYIYEPQLVRTYDIDDDGNTLASYKEERVLLPLEDPKYDSNMRYSARKDRDEWNVVGLTGQVHVRINEEVQLGDKLTAKGGVGYPSNERFGNITVMKITKPYQEDKGYGIALCFIK
ncbi:peptidase G2 autoproteolytic cleavage domain-containing protein [Shouchella sp. 1P09AA]|uniref:peptidase G2 autoproteolytic cleavage domain-containing protein n=1 Tax=unclassified Shouchella TaxID=2893065 RepID=UPI0039A32A3C